jgi:hypothetical protein
VGAVADVDARGVRMHHVETGISDLQPASEFFALFTIQP